MLARAAFQRPLDHAANPLHLLRHAAFLLDQLDSLVTLDRFDRLVVDRGRLGLGNVHRTAHQQRTARCHGRQFRKGHPYRHGLLTFPTGFAGAADSAANVPLITQ